MDINCNAKIWKGQGCIFPVFHMAVLENAISVLGGPSGRQSLFLYCAENSLLMHSMAGRVSQLFDIEFVQNGVFFNHTVVKIRHELAIRISFGTLNENRNFWWTIRLKKNWRSFKWWFYLKNSEGGPK